MKKLIILFLFAFFFIKVSGQTTIDTTHKDSVSTIAIIMNENEYKSLIILLKSADEKPSIISQWIQFLNSRIQLITPNKEQKK